MKNKTFRYFFISFNVTLIFCNKIYRNFIILSLSLLNSQGLQFYNKKSQQKREWWRTDQSKSGRRSLVQKNNIRSKEPIIQTDYIIKTHSNILASILLCEINKDKERFKITIFSGCLKKMIKSFFTQHQNSLRPSVILKLTNYKLLFLIFISHISRQYSFLVRKFHDFPSTFNW